jgi:CheY-like chemotaxis protein
VSRRVLLVDDERPIREMATMLLERARWAVDTDEHGEAALTRLADDAAYDVVVLDHRMPGLTGLATASQLREQGVDLPIVLFSAYLDPEVEAQATRIGVLPVSKGEIVQLPSLLERLTDGRGPAVVDD